MTVGSDSIVVNTITDSETMLIIMIFPLGVIKTNLYASMSFMHVNKGVEK